MGSWTKYFKKTNNGSSYVSTDYSGIMSNDEGYKTTIDKFSNYLPEIYAGHPNRIQRYYQYDEMDQDPVIHIALDTISDFCTQSEDQTNTPFDINFDEKITDTEVQIIKSALNKWVKLNKFRNRLWYIFRNCIKAGDIFFLRDPETQEWLTIDHYNVEMVKVDESKGKEPDEYLIRNLSFSQEAQFATTQADPNQYSTSLGPAGTNALSFAKQGNSGGSPSAGQFQLAGAQRDPRNPNSGSQSFVVRAKDVIHISTNTGLDNNWPFGKSILDPVFKVYKQKELLEDAVIIYRVQRAPERRAFYINVGNMPPQKANAFIERLKNEAHQRRIPNRSSNGSSALDAAYNPVSILDDYYFAVNDDGIGSRVEVLPGGAGTGDILDLTYFDKKLMQGLGIPPEYMPVISETSSTYNDGKVGTAMIQDYHFNKYCIRLQNLFIEVFDKEFKIFISKNGLEVDNTLFELIFFPPQNFSKYREIDIQAARLANYTQVQDNKLISQRKKFLDYLGWTEDEILENERWWSEENPDIIASLNGETVGEEPEGDLSSVGIRSSGGASDFGDFDLGDDEPEGEAPTGDEGGELGLTGPDGQAPAGGETPPA